MKKTYLLLIFTATGFMYAQQAQQKVGTNPTVISPSAVLEIESTTKGLLLPRMTTSQRDAITSPAKGLTIYNTTTNNLEINTGTSAAPVWSSVSNGVFLPLAGGTMTGDIAGATLTLNQDDGTNTTTIGGGTTTGAVTIGGTGAQSINLGSGAGIKTVTLGSTNTTSATTIQGGTDTGAITLTPATTGTIVLGNTAGTGAITLGSSTGAQTTNVGTGTGVSTVNIATGTAANLVQLGAANSQVAVGAAPANASAALAVNTTTKGFLPPRLTTAQRDLITSPATGLTIYNTTTNRLETNVGIPTSSAWTTPVGTGGGIYGGSGALLANTVVAGAGNTLAFTSTITNGFSVDGTTLSVDAANNRVGIGTAAPTRALDVTGGDAAINTVRVGLGEGNIASNTVVGNNALNANTIGSFNTAVGQNTLAVNTTGLANIALGFGALSANTTASRNVAIGYGALAANTTGESNIGVGIGALNANITGFGNIAIGRRAGLVLNTANSQGFNILIGNSSGIDLTTGTSNVFLGGGNDTYVGTGITTGSNNVVIGNNVTGLAAATANNIIIADGSGNRRINVNASGNVGIGTTTPVATLTVNGSVSGTSAYQNLSDKRYKKDVQPIENALDKVLALNGVTFNWDKSKTEMNLDDKNHIGVLAQDIEKVLPQVVNTANDANKTKSVAYSDIVPVLIEAIKEQQAIIQKQQEQVQNQQKQIDELKTQIKILLNK